MSTMGRVESLWRYPVQSMRGEEVDEAFLGFSGVYGDRFFAFTSSAAPTGFPFLTGREQGNMLRYRPRFRSADKAAKAPAVGRGKTTRYSGPGPPVSFVSTRKPLGRGAGH